MSSYNQIQGFEYWNTEAWKDFIRKHVWPLYNLTSKLLKLRDFILTIVGTSGKVTLSEVERKRSDILPLLLGGIKEDGEYKDNSLAKLVRLVLGIYINSKEWVTLEKEERLRAFDYVTVKSETTPFLEFLDKLSKTTLQIIKLVGIEPKEVLESEIEEIILKPEYMLEIIKEIYNKCLHASANHSYYTFFALSTKTLPFRYMVTAYPRLQSNFNLFKEFLGFEKIFEPRINQIKAKEYYTIWGHSKGGLCNSLCELNNIIWENFLNEGVKSVFSYIFISLRDLKTEYVQEARKKLEEMRWKLPDYIKVSDGSYYKGNKRGVYCHSYVISGSMLIKEISWGYSYRENFYSSESECSISLLKLLDDLSPALFLGSILPAQFSSFQLNVTTERLEIVR